jgi:cytochrome c-type biogenesis protein CcmF
VSREAAFLFNNVLFLGITFAVLFGTLYPLIVEATSGDRISVGAPWFNRVNAPIFVALLFLMGVGPALPWGGASWRTIRQRFGLPLLAGVSAVAVGWLLGLRGAAPLAALGLAGFVIVIMGEEVLRGAAARSRSRDEGAATATWRLATRNRRRYGGYLVHAGICVMAVAVAVSATLGSDTTASLAPGESVAIGGYRVTFDRLVTEPLPADPRVVETRAELTLDGPQSGSLRPALRDYPNSTSPIATPAVRTALGEDLYVTLLSYDAAAGSVVLHVFLNPLVAWIWLGGGVVALGGTFAAWPDRRRAVRQGAVAAVAEA